MPKVSFRRTVVSLSALLLLNPLAAPAAPDPQEAAWQAAQESNVAAGYQAYLAEYPKGKYAPVARVKLAILQSGGGASQQPAAKGSLQTATAKKAEAPPPRPTLPFAVPEEVWQAIERSEMYRHLPKRRSIEVSYNQKDAMKLPGMTVTTDQQYHKSITPLAGAANGFSETVESYRIFTINDRDRRPIQSQSSTRSFSLGFISLGSMVDGNPQTRIKRIHQLQGSLFPLRVGNQLSLAYEWEGGQTETTCRVTDKFPAATVRAEFTGNAWSLRCESKSSGFGTTFSSANDTFYIEDLGAFRDEIGITDLSKAARVVPQGATYQYVFNGNTATTFENYRIAVRD